MERLKKQIRILLLLFIALLLLSGVTAFPVESELAFLNDYSAGFPVVLRNWLALVYEGVRETNIKYPFIAYGSDWLAFAHIVIAIFFIGPLQDPVRNIWVLKAGMISCLLVFGLAFIAGPVRGIPFWWQLIDCSFGVFGFLLLIVCYNKIRKLANYQVFTSGKPE